MLESPILYLKVMRILMFQLAGFYCREGRVWAEGSELRVYSLEFLGLT